MVFWYDSVVSTDVYTFLSVPFILFVAVLMTTCLVKCVRTEANAVVGQNSLKSCSVGKGVSTSVTLLH